MDNMVIITNIQRFSLHDGPGIRTTIFLKGCNLKCPWCCNPENIDFNIQNFSYKEEIGKYGYKISLEDLEREILKDKVFYATNGGVTFSGGDALLQFDKLEPLLVRLKKNNINICLETALMSSERMVDIAIKYVDEFIIDIKILDEKNVEKINGNVNLYMKNLKKIFENKCKVVFRIPLVSEYTLTKKNMEKIFDILDKYKPIMVEIFKIHRLGEKKYNTLNLEMPKFKEVDEKTIQNIVKQIEDKGIKTKYCKI